MHLKNDDFIRVMVLAILVVVMFMPQQSIASSPVFNQEYILTSPNSDISDQFGTYVAIHNGVIAVSAPSNFQISTPGLVYLYDSLTGNLINQLSPADGTLNNGFGWMLDIYEEFVVVGTPDSAGSYYVFDVASGLQLHEFALPGTSAKGSFYGPAFAVDNGLVAIGGPGLEREGGGLGVVYVYDMKTAEIKQQLVPDETHAGQVFGLVVDMKDNLVAVTSYINDEENGEFISLVYLFNANTGEQLHIFESETDGGHFGWALAIEQGKIVISSWLEIVGNNEDAVYIYETNSGSLLHRISLPDHQIFDYFGDSIDISNGKLVIGSSGQDFYGQDSGLVYVFDFETAEQLATLIPSKDTLELGGRFGFLIAAEDNKIVANSLYRSDAIYVFDINCPADFNEDYQLDLADVNQFVLDLMSNSSTADLNNDGNFDFFDVSAFLTAFAQGCP